MTAFAAYWELTKPRVVALIVFTALVGMCLAIEGLPDGGQLLRGALGFLGIWLAASSAAAINQLLDARIDAKMARTSWRPLVVGKVTPRQVLVFAGAQPHGLLGGGVVDHAEGVESAADIGPGQV